MSPADIYQGLYDLAVSTLEATSAKDPLPTIPGADLTTLFSSALDSRVEWDLSLEGEDQAVRYSIEGLPPVPIPVEVIGDLERARLTIWSCPEYTVMVMKAGFLRVTHQEKGRVQDYLPLHSLYVQARLAERVSRGLSGRSTEYYAVVILQRDDVHLTHKGGTLAISYETWRQLCTHSMSSLGATRDGRQIRVRLCRTRRAVALIHGTDYWICHQRQLC